MADSTPRSRTSARSGRVRRAGTSRSAAARRAAATRARSRAGGGVRRRTAARSAAHRAPASRASSNGSSSRNGHHGPLDSVGDAVGSAATKVRGPLVAGGAAAAGAIGGIVLGARVLRPRTKRVLGVPIPRDGIGLKPLTKELRKAGKQLGRMADEVGKARAQAEKVGKALT